MGEMKECFVVKQRFTSTNGSYMLYIRFKTIETGKRQTKDSR